MYRPLPDCLTIKDSAIEGIGLFATKFIEKDYSFGISHYELNDSYIRTPLGGFYNHSKNPNCIKVKVGNVYYLKTLKNIQTGKEILNARAEQTEAEIRAMVIQLNKQPKIKAVIPSKINFPILSP